jgi:hypothetical protein
MLLLAYPSSAVEKSLHRGLAETPAVLVCALFVIHHHPLVKVGLQGIRRIVELLAECHPPELIEQRLVKTLADVCGLFTSVRVWSMFSIARQSSYSWRLCAPQYSVSRSLRMLSTRIAWSSKNGITRSFTFRLVIVMTISPGVPAGALRSDDAGTNLRHRFTGHLAPVAVAGCNAVQRCNYGGCRCRAYPASG